MPAPIQQKNSLVESKNYLQDSEEICVVGSHFFPSMLILTTVFPVPLPLFLFFADMRLQGSEN